VGIISQIDLGVEEVNYNLTDESKKIDYKVQFLPAYDDKEMQVCGI